MCFWFGLLWRLSIWDLLWSLSKSTLTKLFDDWRGERIGLRLWVLPMVARFVICGEIVNWANISRSLFYPGSSTDTRRIFSLTDIFPGVSANISESKYCNWMSCFYLVHFMLDTFGLMGKLWGRLLAYSNRLLCYDNSSSTFSYFYSGMGLPLILMF